jgi:hypothetical protein
MWIGVLKSIIDPGGAVGGVVHVTHGIEDWFMSLVFKAIRRPYSLLKMADWPRTSSCAG